MDTAGYFVTDIECTGFRPGDNSMLSFATVAVTAEGEELDRFEAVLAELPGADWNPGTRRWFESSEPEALAAATAEPRDPAAVMAGFVEFVTRITGPRVFVASPLAFDGLWIDYYLRRFTPLGLLQGLYEVDGLFDHALCLRSYTAAVTGRDFADAGPAALPAAWLGDVPHTHRAIDDALGYAHLLGETFRRSGVVKAE
ncbi:hypothetical protein FHX74_001716 [Friedmanniella endophytica]|uniref:Exonuclease n=1 Tax=Microlunatus kandeliicorticis TaxID=1759536 RepID=A0A7W3IRV4_9ACTN|nr:hypothetical protein [Microlunatus kandeliicorticis]MBA8794111.1 hypothetical protein [Microlunatus kandeliicorticis]